MSGRHLAPFCATSLGVTILLGTMTGAVAQSSTIIIAPAAPPAPRTEMIPPSPGGTTMTWQAGHWTWNGVNWVWTDGQYVQRPSTAAVWEPGHWVQQPTGGYTWVDGRWRS